MCNDTRNEELVQCVSGGAVSPVDVDVHVDIMRPYVLVGTT